MPVYKFDEENISVVKGDNLPGSFNVWECEDCGAHGSIHAVVKPLYISIEQDESEV